MSMDRRKFLRAVGAGAGLSVAGGAPPSAGVTFQAGASITASRSRFASMGPLLTSHVGKHFVTGHRGVFLFPGALRIVADSTNGTITVITVIEPPYETNLHARE